MIGGIERLIRALPEPRYGASANVAAVVGFLFGGIGLAIYLRTVADFLIPVGIALAAIVLFGDPGWFAGAVIAGIYGYFRVSLHE
ncbi:hypothetical protein LO762_22465 [Actinocorallia sp. API 0066]|uniref:hypothetical protein n=1 Tax=Actinocorallia sp. API 0066 TaxID=2896846 RepID=UPI001E568A36|nr:hypothetical protein [Actinocorallia sp. API 0066]MCD0451936.1 hypothetical protein [Actinocorallia sp. API 0066]